MTATVAIGLMFLFTFIVASVVCILSHIPKDED